MSDDGSRTEPGRPTSRHRPPRGGWLATLGDYGRLMRPRIVALVLLTMTIAALTAAATRPAWPVLGHALLGAGMVIVGAIALNQRWEVRSDGAMSRTAIRPLPSGRLSERQVTRFGLVASAAGLGYLALAADPLTLGLVIASWVVYVWVYTPLKMFTAWQSPVGAVAGAMPVLLGAAAAGAPWSVTALGLFAVVYFWQFPHAMAIAWLYRQQFASARVKVATVTDPSGRTAARLAVIGAIALLPASLLPLLDARVGWAYGTCALALGLGYLASAVRLLGHTDDTAARRLLWASLVYLPAVLVALLLDCLG
jgi:protoheme IX farnesyltransferase